MELQKMVLGMEILLINVSKVVIIYVFAALLGVLGQTFIVHAAFVLIKRYSFGLHALNSTVCAVVSCCMFVVVPWLLPGLGMNNYMVITIFSIIIFVLYLYAPADTKARPLIGENNRKRLKKKAIACGIIAMIVTLLIPSEPIKLLFVLGAVYQCISILPFTYKILKRGERNYEVYERA